MIKKSLVAIKNQRV